MLYKESNQLAFIAYYDTCLNKCGRNGQAGRHCHAELSVLMMEYQVDGECTIPPHFDLSL